MEQKKVKGSNITYKTKKKEVTKKSKNINLGVNSCFDVGDIAYILSDKEYNSLTNDSGAITELEQQITVLTNRCNDLLNSNKELSDKVTAYDKQLTNDNKTITELKQQIEVLSNRCDDLQSNNKDLSDKVTNYENEITSLNHLINSKDKAIADITSDVEKYQQTKQDLEIAIKENKELISDVKDRDNYINYLERVQSDSRVLIQYLNLYLEQYQQRNIIKRLANSDVDMTKPILNYIDFKGNVSDDITVPLIDVPKKEFNSD